MVMVMMMVVVVLFVAIHLFRFNLSPSPLPASTIGATFLNDFHFFHDPHLFGERNIQCDAHSYKILLVNGLKLSSNRFILALWHFSINLILFLFIYGFAYDNTIPPLYFYFYFLRSICFNLVYSKSLGTPFTSFILFFLCIHENGFINDLLHNFVLNGVFIGLCFVPLQQCPNMIQK